MTLENRNYLSEGPVPDSDQAVGLPSQVQQKGQEQAPAWPRVTGINMVHPPMILQLIACQWAAAGFVGSCR